MLLLLLVPLVKVGICILLLVIVKVGMGTELNTTFTQSGAPSPSLLSKAVATKQLPPSC